MEKRVSTSLRFSTKAKAFDGFTRERLRNMMMALGEQAKEYAQKNVKKGKGPSPHPHKKHWWHNFKWEDTGALAESVQVRYRQAGFLRTVTIYTDLDYGMYLELGFRGPSGMFYRYPWMKPAYQKAQKDFPKFATQALKHAIEEASVASPIYLDDPGIQQMTEYLKMKGMQSQKDKGDDYDLNQEIGKIYKRFKIPKYDREIAEKGIAKRRAATARRKLRKIPEVKQVQEHQVRDIHRQVLSDLRKSGPGAFHMSKRTRKGRPVITYNPLRLDDVGRGGESMNRKKKKR